MLSYSDLCALSSFEDRFNYLRLNGSVGIETFGFNRFLNQVFYAGSAEWRKARNFVLLRDNGCDLGIQDRPIGGRIYVHHMNPISEAQIIERDPIIFDPEFLICTSLETHNAIHFSDSSILVKEPVERFAGDTKLW